MDLFKKFLADLRRRVEKLEKGFNRSNVILPSDGILKPPVVAGDPTSPTEGQIWYDSSSHTWRGRKASTTVTFTTS
jgi:hypothetical protein